MTTFLQFHFLTFVPPANLNRDDTGTPKTAMIGGDLRLRLSSQSLKRAWRESDVFAEKLAGHLGARTQRFGEKIRAHLEGNGIGEEKALEVTREVIKAFGKPKDARDEKNPVNTEQLAFLSPQEMDAALKIALDIANGVREIDAKEMAKTLLRTADTAADIAMFGRMFADNAEFNREAAVQVAHAVTTHRVVIEDDFYTAVDDLKKPSEDAGAGFVGDAGFGSGIFYLYVCVDKDLLVSNLDGDVALAKNAIAALVEAAAKVAPNGKQASFASRIHAGYLMAEKGTEAPRTLAGAFSKSTEPFIEAATSRLEEMCYKFDKAYGQGDVRRAVMKVSSGEGSLREVITFATDWSE